MPQNRSKSRFLAYSYTLNFMQKFQVLRFNVTLLTDMLHNDYVKDQWAKKEYFNEQNRIILRRLTNCIK